MEKELWEAVKDYEGLYEVSSFGRVKSFKFGKERVLKPSIDSSGYYSVVLSDKIKGKSKRIHQLVAESFLNHMSCGHKLVIDHINDDKLDNRVKNLQVVTARFNTCKTRGNYSSKYKGVCWYKERNNWTSMININGKSVFLGYFKCELEAHQAYQNKLKEII